VLVAGGASDDYSPVSSAEVYDPVTGQWTTTGHMRTSRFGHEATLLLDGRVMVQGGYDGHTSELYNPVTGFCDYAGDRVWSSWGDPATLLGDGRVLVVPYGGAEIYTPWLSPTTHRAYLSLILKRAGANVRRQP
jgi:hypothetical protein